MMTALLDLLGQLSTLFFRQRKVWLYKCKFRSARVRMGDITDTARAAIVLGLVRARVADDGAAHIMEISRDGREVIVEEIRRAVATPVVDHHDLGLGQELAM